MPVLLRRVYEKPRPEDGLRILVDRLWPRGLTKDTASVDLWLKDIAPSTTLRKWFNHEPAKWPEFLKRYRKELAQHTEHVERLRSLTRAQTVTLVFAAKDQTHNDAVALAKLLSL